MEAGSLVHQALVLLAAAVVAVPVFHRLRLSPVLGYLVAGVAVGPHAMALITGVQDIARLGELGVVFLLFAIGLELKLSRFLVMRRLVFGLGGAQVAATALVLAGLVLAVGEAWSLALVVGAGLALSSSAVALQILTERGDLARSYGRVAFAVLLMQDLAVVPLLILVSALAGDGHSASSVLLGAAARAVVAVAAVLAVGRWLAQPFLRMVAASGLPEALGAATLFLVLGIGLVTAQAGLSMALGAFLAGLLLAETEFRHQVEAEIQPFRALLLGLFFMTVGMRLDLGLLAGSPVRVALLLAVMLAAKLAVMVALGLAFRLSLAVALPAALVLAQGGEFAFVLFDQAARSAILRPEQAAILRLAVTASMMATPGLAALAARTAHRLRPAPAEGVRLDAAAAMADHVIVAGFGRVGRTVARLLERRHIAYLALDLNPERVAAARARGKPVFYADAGRPEVLRAAGAAGARALVLTLDRPGVAEAAVQTCRLNFPDLPIYARARDARRSDRLRGVGATLAVPETVEASLQLGAAVLRGGGVADDDLRQLLAELRRDDYAGLGE